MQLWTDFIEAADPAATSVGSQLTGAFTDLKAAQVKTISFFTFLLRVTPSLLQPHKVNTMHRLEI